MPEGTSVQMQVTFEDITVSFSKEEWGYLNDRQKELYREVMKENYETLISLGTGSLTVTADIISHIEQGEELYIRDKAGSEEKETGKSSCSDHQIKQERKREKKQGENPIEMEQIQRRSENVCENISQGTKRINTKNCQQESEEQRNPAGDSSDGVTICERNDRELTNIPEHQIYLAERSFQNGNGNQVTSKLHQEEGKGKEDQKEFTCTAYNRSICFIYPKLNESFPLFSDLQMHTRSHTKKDRFTCTECNKSFFWLSCLKRHQKTHAEDKPFTCSECNKSFTQISHLKIHQQTHTGVKPFTCTECNKSFTLLSHLKRHQKTHTADKSFICTDCNKSFPWLSNLKIHQRIHTGEKPFICSECKKSFTQLSDLKNHQKTHTGAKPFTCPECNKSFTWLSTLKGHQAIHTGDKPFTCAECNKCFTWLSNLKVHQKIHTGDKPFTCSECNKSFTQLSNLKTHQLIHT